ncbi:transmembrane protein 70 homolog, mitochondrial [Plodia interpunctella]|uniref:transmembrane protein 70 homolog, mitochondrial n=1 Tax=Plodia interpunctella TaxID=58824 RepID=UPI00236796BC|nr:transmembrane protein 70 homolog, mitochondrial [Plodia interpunctella]
MFRLCVRNTISHYRLSYQQNVHNQKIASKTLTIVHNIFGRNYCSKQTEDNLENIYYGPLTPQIRAVKLFSLGSSIAGLIAQPIIIREASAIGSTSLLVAVCSVVGFFTFVTPILLHIVTKKYVTDIIYDPDSSTYKATTINFFLARKQIEFKPDDVQVPDIPGMFTTMNAKGKPLFIEARHFNNPLHYAKIMGYDKPMDFKLGDTNYSDSESKQK